MGQIMKSLKTIIKVVVINIVPAWTLRRAKTGRNEFIYLSINTVSYSLSLLSDEALSSLYARYAWYDSHISSVILSRHLSII